MMRAESVLPRRKKGADALTRRPKDREETIIVAVAVKEYHSLNKITRSKFPTWP